MEALRKTYSPAQVRLFRSDFLESLTHSNSVIILTIWYPVAFAFLFNGFRSAQSMGTFAVGILIGLFSWSIIEYFAHRVLYHFPVKSPLLRQYMYMYHGVHHREPFASSRVTMPVLPAALFFVVAYLGLNFVIPERYFSSIFGAYILGYALYESLHFAIHRLDLDLPFIRYMRRHHMAHHLGGPQQKFGLTTPIWDYVFGTLGKKV